MTRLVTTLLFVLLSIQCSGWADAPTYASDLERSVIVDGEPRTYLLHIPPSSNRPMPLVLVLHGGGGRASGMRNISGMDRVADKYAFVVVYPQGIGMVFNDGGSDLGARDRHDDVQFVRHLIKDAAQQAPIDESRVFACGLSNGGAMTARLALEASDVIKAAAMVGAGLYVKQEQQHPDPKPIPVMFIQGTDDPCHLYNGGESRGPNFGTRFRGQTHGAILSTDAVLSFWCRVNHCSQTPETVQIPHVTRDNTSTTCERFPGADGKDVVAYIVSGGGHCWPGGVQYFPVSVIGRTTYDFSASEAIWRFFAAHGGSK
jgi:polyhydroxybutyrate depolymerase